MPGTCEVARRRRLMTSPAVALRAGLSRRVMNSRPEFGVLAALPPPAVDITDTTSGSRLTISASRAWRSTMAANEASSGPTVDADSRPISSCGKNPLGTTWNSTMVSTNVPRVAASISLLCETVQRTAWPYRRVSRLKPASKSRTGSGSRA